MDDKMRVGRLHLDGSWSGAIGAYLAKRVRKAEGENAGREEGRQTTAGYNTFRTRERILRVLSALAIERNIEWIHKMSAEDYVEVRKRIIAEAMTDPRVRGELKSSTIRSIAISLKAFVRFCKAKGWIPIRQADEILEDLPVLALENTRFKLIPSTAWPTMFAAARKRHLLEVVVLALGLYLLMRDSEMRRVRWSDFDLETGMVTFKRDKRGGASLTVPLARDLISILKEWEEWLKAHFGIEEVPGHWPVVPARAKRTAGGKFKMHTDWPVDITKPIGSVTLEGIIKQAGRSIGLTDEELFYQAVHLLRRSGAEDLYQHGSDIRLIAELLGHGQPGKPNTDQTMRYLGHWVDLDKMRAAVNREDPNAVKARGIGQPVGTDLAVVQSVAVIDDARVKIAEWVTAGQLTIDEGLKIAALVAQG